MKRIPPAGSDVRMPGEVSRTLEGGTAGAADLGLHLAREHERECGLAESRRPGQEDMVERLAAQARGLHQDLQVLTEPILADELGQPSRPQARLEDEVLLLWDRIHQRGTRHDTLLGHGERDEPRLTHPWGPLNGPGRARATRKRGVDRPVRDSGESPGCAARAERARSRRTPGSECASLRNPFAVLLPNLYELRGYIARHAASYRIGYLCILANNAFSLAIPQVMRAGVNRLQAGGGGMARYGLTMVALAAGGGLFLYFMRRILIGTSRQVEYEIRRDFFGHLQTLPLSFFQRQKTGDLMARASNDINAVRDCTGPGVMYGMNTVTTVVASIVLMVRIDPVLTAATLVPLPLLALLVRHFSGEMHRRARAVQDQYGVLSSGLQENIAGIRVVQAYVQEKREEEHFDGLGREYMRLGFRLIRYRSLFFSTMGSLIALLTLILLWLGGMSRDPRRDPASATSWPSWGISGC